MCLPKDSFEEPVDSGLGTSGGVKGNLTCNTGRMVRLQLPTCVGSDKSLQEFKLEEVEVVPDECDSEANTCTQRF